MSSILYKLLQRCLDPNSDDHTRDTYTHGLRKFTIYLDEAGISQRKAIRAANNNDTALVQQYCDWLTQQKYASASIHTFLAPICKAFGINMQIIDKPPRISSRILLGAISCMTLRATQLESRLCQAKAENTLSITSFHSTSQPSPLL